MVNTASAEIALPDDSNRSGVSWGAVVAGAFVAAAVSLALLALGTTNTCVPIPFLILIGLFSHFWPLPTFQGKIGSFGRSNPKHEDGAACIQRKARSDIADLN
jgi:hypothetical protein